MTANRRAWWEALALNLVWINVSEVARYFLLVRPMMASTYAMVPGIVPATAWIAALWTLWDGLLIAVVTAITWLVLTRFGPSVRAAIGAGTLAWAGVFVLLWLGLHNMGLATPALMATALPLAWLELAIAALLTAWRLRRTGLSA